MADPVWPASLPQKPEAGGWSYTPQPNTIRFTPDVGPDITRRRMSAVHRLYEATFPPLTDAQLATFETFYETTTKTGTLRYSWTDPVDATTELWRIQTFTVRSLGAGFHELTMRILRLP